MVNIFLLHGALGHPDENWFPWLREELEKQGHEVVIPTFPTPENQSLESWMRAFKQHTAHLNQETLLVGHSLAPAFILHILEELHHPVEACFFVSGFTSKLGDKKMDTLNKSFLKEDFDWDKIRNNCPYFHVYHSDNDPHVLVEHAHKLADNLSVKAHIIKGAGHFNEAANYTTFEKLRDDVENFL